MVSCRVDGTPDDGPSFKGPPPAPSSAPYTAYYGPPGELNVLTRQLVCLPVTALLYTAAIPFTPVVWVMDIEGATLFDRLFAGIIVLSACYFQWRIAGLKAPLAVFLPGASSTTIRNGRIGRNSSMGFVWHPSNYWPYVICEAMLLGVAEFGPSELLRRGIVCAVIAGLWLVGWHATPESTRKWAYDQIKAWVFWILLDEFLRIGARSHSSRRRR